MFKTVLVALDGTPTDRTIVDQVKPIARIAQSHIVVIFIGSCDRISPGDINNSVGVDELGYLTKIREEFKACGITTEIALICHDPVTEIAEQVQERNCDLVVMTGHGRQSVADLIFGDIANRVQASIRVPVLLFPAKQTEPRGLPYLPRRFEW